MHRVDLNRDKVELNIGYNAWHGGNIVEMGSMMENTARLKEDDHIFGPDL